MAEDNATETKVDSESTEEKAEDKEEEANDGVTNSEEAETPEAATPAE